MSLVYGASVSGKPHLVTVATWPADPDQLVLSRCGRLALREIPEPAPGHLCGSCRRLHEGDQRQEAAARRHHQRHLEPVCRQIAVQINRLRNQLLADAEIRELIEGHAYRYLAHTRTTQQGQHPWKL